MANDAGALASPTTERRSADDPIPWRYPTTADRDRAAPQGVTPGLAGRSIPLWTPTPAEHEAAGQRPGSSPGSHVSETFGPRLDRFQTPPLDPPFSEPATSEPRAVLYERAEALARVGTEVILAAEVTMGLDEARAKAIESMRAKSGGRVPPAMLEELDRQVKEAIRKRLEHKVQVALICQHAAREIPADHLKRIREIVGREFEKREVPEMMKVARARSRRELEDKLLAAGMSLEARKREWIDQALAADWLRQQVRPNTDISHDEMLAYYHAHAAEFERPARARWEQLTVRVSKYSSREEARAALAEMGNLVLHGVPLAEVAKERSDGPTAARGGLRDWTSRGSLTAEILDRAIFGLPVGELSPILEEDKLMHIVRVVERHEAKRTPFGEAQAEIREKIRKQRETAAREAFLASLRRQIPVWTVFDDEQAKRPLPGSLLIR